MIRAAVTVTFLLLRFASHRSSRLKSKHSWRGSV